MAGLLEIVDHACRALFAQRLVIFLAANGIGVADDQHQRIVGGFSLRCCGAQFGLGTGRNYGSASIEIDVRRALDIVFVDIGHAPAESFGCGGLLLELLCGSLANHPCGLQVAVPEGDLACDQAVRSLQGLDRDRQAGEQGVCGQLAAAATQKAAACADLRVIGEGDDGACAVGRRNLDLVIVARGNDALDLRARWHCSAGDGDRRLCRVLRLC